MKINNIIKYYLFFQPVIGFLYYYLKIHPTTYISHFFIGLFVLYSILSIKNIRKSILFVLITFFSIIFISTFIELVNSMDITSNAFLKHFSSYIMVFSLFILGQKINFLELFKSSHKFIYIYLLFDLIVLIFFKIDLLGRHVYPSFESSYLIPTFIYSLLISNKFMLFLHLILFVIHAKRAILIFALLILFIYLFFNSNSTKKYILIILATLSIAILSTMNLEAIINIRYINIYYAFLNNDLSYVSSLGEKIQEIVNSYSLKTNIFNIFFGNGLGWHYFIPNINMIYEPRSYTHFTIVFIFIVNGITGVLLFLYFNLRIIFSCLQCQSDNMKLTAYVVLSYFLISFSVLNLFTDPLYPLFLGSFFAKRKIGNE